MPVHDSKSLTLTNDDEELCLERFVAQKTGWSSCPAPLAGKIERFVVQHIAAMVRDPELVRATFREAQREVQPRIADLKHEQKTLKQQIRHDSERTRQLATCGVRNEAVTTGLADRVRRANGWLQEIGAELTRLQAEEITEAEVSVALADFESLWATLATREKTRLLDMLIERITVHGADGHLNITFRPTGIKTLMVQREEVAA